jgi:hypothetical protein
MLPSSSPSFYAGLFGVLVGLGLIVFGVKLLLTSSTPTTLDIALIVVGMAEVATSALTIRALRAAWAFALSLNGTLALVLLFSGPRIRDAAEVSIGVALIPSVVFLALVVLHSLRPEDF